MLLKTYRQLLGLLSFCVFLCFSSIAKDSGPVGHFSTMLIITHPDYRDAVDTLARWKTSDGIHD